MHIVIEAMDGGGKGTVARGLAAYVRDQGFETLEVSEPTNIGLGKFIREELTAKHADGRTYPATLIARAFSMDREQLCREKIFPFLDKGGKVAVIQDRSVLSSFVYQPAQDASVTLDWLLSLEGNQVELSRPPDLLMILRIDVDTAMNRLAGRSDKDDNSIFERTDFQRVVADRYRDPKLLAPFQERGTRIVEVNSGQTEPEVLAEAIEKLRSALF